MCVLGYRFLLIEWEVENWMQRWCFLSHSRRRELVVIAVPVVGWFEGLWVVVLERLRFSE